MSSCDIKMLSWDSYGNLSILIDGKEYNYCEVNIDEHIRLKAYVKYKNYKAFFRLVNSFRKEPL